jgi:sugar-specific transcriptional regulator TrmB
MDKTEIQKKSLELKDVLSKYQSELSQLEKELFNAISEYQKMVDEERIKELRESLTKHE